MAFLGRPLLPAFLAAGAAAFRGLPRRPRLAVFVARFAPAFFAAALRGLLAFLAVVPLAALLLPRFAVVFLAVVFFAVLFFAVDFLPVFLAVVFFAVLFLAVVFLPVFFAVVFRVRRVLVPARFAVVRLAVVRRLAVPRFAVVRRAVVRLAVVFRAAVVRFRAVFRPAPAFLVEVLFLLIVLSPTHRSESRFLVLRRNRCRIECNFCTTIFVAKLQKVHFFSKKATFFLKSAVRRRVLQEFARLAVYSSIRVCESGNLTEMKYTDQLIRLTRDSADAFVRAAKAIPEDKLRWSVQDAGRTPLDIFQEVAQAPLYTIPMLEARACPPFDPEKFGEYKAQRAKWDTIEECESVMNSNLGKLFSTIRSFPESELSYEIDLPFVEGLRQSMADIMAYPYWNTSYHLGQICFIQTLYGDKEMR